MRGKSREPKSIATTRDEPNSIPAARDCGTSSSLANTVTVTHCKAANANATCASNAPTSLVPNLGLVHKGRF
jgi:hypothetical protein